MRLLLALVPVTLFLGSLLYLDSYKLVRLRTILQLILAGCAAAIVSYAINQLLLERGVVDDRWLTRLVAPVVEEAWKAIPFLILLRIGRIGFLVDAAITGFAIGTGFGLVENLYYLSTLPDAPPGLWIVRGFGTAVMHGGTSAILAVATRALSQRRESDAPWLAAPGFVIAAAVHSGFNQFVLSPLMSTLVIVLVLPPLLVWVFAQSERYLQAWLGSGFDLASELLIAIRSGNFAATPPGRYLQALRERFEPAVVADMLCYLQLHSELSIRAKGMLMMRENGFPVKKDAETEAKLAEMRYLKRSIGKTGELALAPFVRRSSHDLWELRMLEEA